jgi:hypothetical protein
MPIGAHVSTQRTTYHEPHAMQGQAGSRRRRYPRGWVAWGEWPTIQDVRSTQLHPHVHEGGGWGLKGTSGNIRYHSGWGGTHMSGFSPKNHTRKGIPSRLTLTAMNRTALRRLHHQPTERVQHACWGRRACIKSPHAEQHWESETKLVHVCACVTVGHGQVTAGRVFARTVATVSDMGPGAASLKDHQTLCAAKYGKKTHVCTTCENDAHHVWCMICRCDVRTRCTMCCVLCAVCCVLCAVCCVLCSVQRATWCKVCAGQRAARFKCWVRPMCTCMTTAGSLTLSSQETSE